MKMKTKQSIYEQLCVSDSSSNEYIPQNEICEEAMAMIARWEAMTLEQGNQRPSDYVNPIVKVKSCVSDILSPPTRYRRRNIDQNN